jgi:rRNA-processing protein FCF1
MCNTQNGCIRIMSNPEVVDTARMHEGRPIATLDDDLRRAANKAGVKTFKPT